MNKFLLPFLLFCVSFSFAQTDVNSVKQTSPVKEEKLDGGKYIIYRTTINDGGVITVFEKKHWTWGGMFVYKNGVEYPFIEGKETPIITWEREKNELVKKVEQGK